MPPSTTEATQQPGGVAAAKARHPAGRRRSPAAPARFADLVALFTGPWRVSDPSGFAAAMTGDPVLAGHRVSDATRGGDPLDDRLVQAVAGAAGRADLDVRWVAGSQSGLLFVEARAEAPAGPGGPELFVVAHLVERRSAGGPHGAAGGDHSWAVLACGDGAGGVAGIVRVTLSCPGRRRCCPPPSAAVRLSLAALRARLAAPAMAAEEPDGSGDQAAQSATIVAFRPRR